MSFGESVIFARFIQKNPQGGPTCLEDSRETLRLNRAYPPR
jgi:hypothetical protein